MWKEKIERYLAAMIMIGMMLSVFSGCARQGKKSDASKAKDDRIVLVLGNYDYYNSTSEQVMKYVDEFNRTNDTYRIEVRDYSKTEDADVSFNLDVSSGEMPDIVVTNRDRLDRLIYTGLLADMQTYLDADPDLHKEDFLENLMSAWLQEGGLYYVSTEYYITVLFGKQKMVGQYSEGWTKEEMIDYAETSETPMFYENGKWDLYNQFLANGYSEFVDWNTGKANFDSDIFARIIEYCNRGVQNPDRYPIGSEWVASLVNDKNILAGTSVNSFTEMEDITRKFGMDLCYVGFPDMNKEISNIQFLDCMGISSRSKYKDIAWQFVRSMLTKDAQYEVCSGVKRFSIRNDVFAMEMKAAMATESYTDEYGNQIDPEAGTSDSMRYTPLTQEEAQLTEKLVRSARHCTKVDHKIEDIVTDEVAAYFNGDCAVDRVGEAINSRVETYMSENR